MIEMAQFSLVAVKRSPQLKLLLCATHLHDIHILCLFSADGVALGAAAASSQVSVQVVVFFAVILHKVRLHC